MKKSDIQKLSGYYRYYIDLNEDVELDEAFNYGLNLLDNLNLEAWKRVGLQPYAEGKWSLHRVIQHLSDWERIWSYRTLVAARKLDHIPSALDHNHMAAQANSDQLSLEALLAEFRAVRLSSMALFGSFGTDTLHRECRFSDSSMSILAMGFNIVGHQLHHFKIIEERYLNARG